MISIQIQCAGAKVKGEYVLPEMVRVPCSNKVGPNRCEWQTNMGLRFGMVGDGKCSACHGLGWTPAVDGWVWWRAVRQARVGVQSMFAKVVDGWRIRVGYNNEDPETVLLEEVYNALEVLDAVFPVVEA